MPIRVAKSAKRTSKGGKVNTVKKTAVKKSVPTRREAKIEIEKIRSGYDAETQRFMKKQGEKSKRTAARSAVVAPGVMNATDQSDAFNGMAGGGVGEDSSGNTTEDNVNMGGVSYRR